MYIFTRTLICSLSGEKSESSSFKSSSIFSTGTILCGSKIDKSHSETHSNFSCVVWDKNNGKVPSGRGLSSEISSSEYLQMYLLYRPLNYKYSNTKNKNK